jgi:mannose-1-phosphate guanylyltransferase / mannose-6-phosphate isomerase
LEPSGRNTAPAVTLGALAAIATGDDPVMVVSPTDHSVGDAMAFSRAVDVAIEQAANGAIVTLGVVPHRAETGYGYIQADRSTSLHPSDTAYVVKAFVEKPDAPTAQSYIDSGDFYWNGGLFVMRASRWLEALNAFRPDILQAVQAAWDARQTDTIGAVGRCTQRKCGLCGDGEITRQPIRTACRATASRLD